MVYNITMMIFYHHITESKVNDMTTKAKKSIQPTQPILPPQPELDVDFKALNDKYLRDKEYALLMRISEPTTKPEVKVRKSPVRNTIKLLVDGERGYVTIPALQEGEGIPIINRGHCPNWTKIRNGIKKGVLNWTLGSGVVIKIEMV
jgi:hypothetical protein